MVEMPSRREVLRTTGTSALGLVAANTAFSSSATAEVACPGGCPDPWDRAELSQADSFTGTVPNEDDDFTITLSTSVISHEPIYRESIGQWELDISVSGISDCRYVDSDSPAEQMWFQECSVEDYSADLYTRDNSNWAGVKIGDDESPSDYESNPVVESAVGIAISLLNSYAGLAYSTTQFLEALMEEYGDEDDLGRKWYFDSPSGITDQHHTGYFFKYRAEMDSGEALNHDVTDLAVASPEYPVSNTFTLTSETPPDPSYLNTQTESEFEIKRYDPHKIENLSQKNPRIAAALKKEDSPIYVAHDWPVKVEAKPNHVPERLRQKYNNLDW